MRTRRLVPALAVGLLLASCSADTEEPTATVDSIVVDPATDDLTATAEGRTLIDVRTAEEFAAGAIDGAENIDVQSPDFDALVADLPRDEPYLVYCRSGNRSAQAIERMGALGFTDLVNGGAYEDLAAAGLPTAS